MLAPALAAAQPGPFDPYVSGSYGGSGYGGATYGGASYGGGYGGGGYGSAGYGGAGDAGFDDRGGWPDDGLRADNPFGDGREDARAGRPAGHANGGVQGFWGVVTGRDRRVPAVLATTSTEVARIDARGGRIVLAKPVTLPGPVARHFDTGAFVDEATGRWALPRQPTAHGSPWTIVFGDARGAITEIAANADCRRGRSCFVSVLAIRGDDILVRVSTMRGDLLARYQFGRPGRQVLAGKAVANTVVFSPALDHVAFASPGGLTVAAWGRDGVARPARGTHRRRPQPAPAQITIAVAGEVKPLALLDGVVYYQRLITTPERRVVGAVVEAYDLASGARAEIYRPKHLLLTPWEAVSTNARGTALVHDCGSASGRNECDVIELGAGQAHVLLRGVVVVHDVSADGRYVLVRRAPAATAGRATAWDDLAVIDLASGRDARVITEVEAASAQFTR
ncbi:MAG: hypothetical protein R3B06_01675 [Kofleriaceae bacterium]